MMEIDARQLNSLTLAYIGDAVYELFIREHLVRQGTVKPDKLHHLAIGYVAADKQASVIHAWINQGVLEEEEQNVIRRGRNAKSHTTPKNMSIADYRYATAFETLLGYHHLRGNRQRLQFLMGNAVDIVETKKE